MAGPGIICPTQETAAFANSRNNAPARRSGRSHATSTKKRVITLVHLRAPLSLTNRATSVKKVEMRFAHLKTHHRFECMRLRGLSGARDEFHLAATVQNLKTLANCLWPSPPNVAVACVT
jgi:DDE family transposase